MKNKYIITALSLISVLIFLFLSWFIYLKPAAVSAYAFTEYLPLVNCIFNSASAICLVLGVRAIAQKKQATHKAFMLSALCFSAFFLASYLVYHHYQGDTLFLATGLIRPIYFFTLISHILLTIVGLPFILITFFFALTTQFTLHKRIAKWTFPIWLYVSVSGVLIYIFQVLFN